MKNQKLLVILFFLFLLNLNLVISEEFGYNILKAGRNLNPSTPSGNSSFNETLIDENYLRLDTTNDPLTNALRIDGELGLNFEPTGNIIDAEQTEDAGGIRLRGYDDESDSWIEIFIASNGGVRIEASQQINVAPKISFLNDADMRFGGANPNYEFRYDSADDRFELDASNTTASTRFPIFHVDDDSFEMTFANRAFFDGNIEPLVSNSYTIGNGTTGNVWSSIHLGTGASSSAGIFQFITDAGTRYGSNGESEIHFESSSDNLEINPSLSGTHDLDILGNTNLVENDDVYLQTNATGSNSDSGLRLTNDAVTWNLRAWGGSGDRFTIADEYSPASADIKFVIETTGDIGIAGATNPQAEFQIGDGSLATVGSTPDKSFQLSTKTSGQEVGNFYYINDGVDNIRAKVSLDEAVNNFIFAVQSDTTYPDIVFNRQANDVFKIATSGASASASHVSIPNDQQKLFFGTSDDSSLSYNGSDTIIDVQEVGTGSLYIPNGNVTHNNIYGGVTGSNIGEIIIGSSLVYYNVTNVTAQLLNGFSFNNGFLTVQVGGVYRIASGWSFSGGANTEYHLAIAINGVRDLDCHSIRVIGSGGDVGSASTSPCYKRLNVGDTINLQIENVDSAVNPNVQDIGLVVDRVGN